MVGCLFLWFLWFLSPNKYFFFPSGRDHQLLQVSFLCFSFLRFVSELQNLLKASSESANERRRLCYYNKFVFVFVLGRVRGRGSFCFLGCSWGRGGLERWEKNLSNVNKKKKSDRSSSAAATATATLIEL
jgi:hypothetical protein